MSSGSHPAPLGQRSGQVGAAAGVEAKQFVGGRRFAVDPAEVEVALAVPCAADWPRRAELGIADLHARLGTIGPRLTRGSAPIRLDPQPKSHVENLGSRPEER